MLKAKQATKCFIENSLYLKANIKVSFVALNQIRNSKNECDFKKIVSGQFWDCCVQQNCSHFGAHCLAEFNFYASQVRRSLGQLFVGISFAF